MSSNDIDEEAAPPPPLAGEGPQEEKTLTRRYAPTSPASGRG